MTHTHTRWESSGRGISPWERRLLNNKRHSQKKVSFMLPSELEPVIPANERPQTHTLDRAVNGIKYYLFIYLLIYKLVHN